MTLRHDTRESPPHLAALEDPSHRTRKRQHRGQTVNRPGAAVNSGCEGSGGTLMMSWTLPSSSTMRWRGFVHGLD